MKILIEDQDHHPVPINKFSTLDEDCIALMKKHNLRYLHHDKGCLVSDVKFLLQEMVGFTIDV